MARPQAGYALPDGTKVPGVTSIVRVYGTCEGLVKWAWKLGMEGKKYWEVQRQAADVGTAVHEKIEAWLKGQPIPVAPRHIEPQAALAYANFAHWVESSGLQVEALEQPLVHHALRYGGTPDAVTTCGSLMDWKTSRGLYQEHLAQVGGYSILMREVAGRPVSKARILRLDKDGKGWVCYTLDEDDLARTEEAFRVALRAYTETLTLEALTTKLR